MGERLLLRLLFCLGAPVSEPQYFIAGRGVPRSQVDLYYKAGRIQGRGSLERGIYPLTIASDHFRIVDGIFLDPDDPFLRITLDAVELQLKDSLIILHGADPLEERSSVYRIIDLETGDNHGNKIEFRR